MPDIFLSYNREDQATARRFAKAFQAEGFEVWWDTTLRAGEAYDQVTEKALKTAKAVVVLWSPRSVDSRWVRAEATLADRQKTLVPVTIEPCERPIMFELTQTAELSHWEGDVRDKAWQTFMGDLKRFVQAATPVSAPDADASGPLGQAPVRQADRPSICVLPFANMSRDEDQEYFADGISEDIITDLSKVSALGVISRNTAFTFKGKPVDLKQVALQLGVTHVLEGSVRKAGARVRITAQLIEGASDNHVWADRWDRDLDDIFALQDEISQAIVGALKLTLLPGEKAAIEDRGTTNFTAFDTSLRARALANNAQGPDDLLRARDLFRQALDIDPEFASARSGLALVYIWIGAYAPERLAQAVKDLEALAREGFERGPDHWGSQAATAAALFYRRDWTGSVGAFEKALALAPPSNTAIAPIFAVCLATLGRIRDCTRLLENARNADPLDRNVSNMLQQVLYFDGRGDDSRLEYERTLDLPGHREAEEQAALFRVWDLGDARATKAQFHRFLDHQMRPMPALEKVAEAFDRPEIVRALLREAFDDPENQDGTRTMQIGWYAGRFGDLELAVAALRRGSIEFGSSLTHTLWHPFQTAARQTPAFKQLVRDLGIYDYWRQSRNWGDFARPVGDDDFEIIR